MEFKRRRVRGQTQKVFRTWFSEDGQYRITWAKQVFGISVDPHYHVCVRVRVSSGHDCWDFAGRRGPYRTLKAATDAAEKHRKVWEYATQIAEVKRGLFGRLWALHLKARVGRCPEVNVLLGVLPVWIIENTDPEILQRIKKHLFPSDVKQNEPEESEELETDGVETLMKSDSTMISDLDLNDTGITKRKKKTKKKTKRT